METIPALPSPSSDRTAVWNGDDISKAIRDGFTRSWTHMPLELSLQDWTIGIQDDLMKYWATEGCKDLSRRPLPWGTESPTVPKTC